jgi:restriction endonuclease/RNA recognition motif-containing protein
MSVRLFVGALPYSASSTTISTLLWDWAPLESAKVVLDRDTGRIKGFGYASVATPDDAVHACRANGALLDGRPISVSVERPRARRVGDQRAVGLPYGSAGHPDLFTSSARSAPNVEIDFDGLQADLVQALRDPTLRDFWVTNSLHRLDPRNGNSHGESMRHRVARLVEILAESPALLVELNPQLFEYIIAALLSASGYNHVKMTAPSADGGVDIFASRNSGLGRAMYIVQCKRYAPTRKITRPDVQLTYGVLAASRGTGATIVTTSSFTTPAAEFLEENKNQISGINGTDLENWLRATAQIIDRRSRDQL